MAEHRQEFERQLEAVFFFQAEDGIRDSSVTGVQTCALPILGLLHRLHEQGHTIILITHDAKVAAEAERLIQITDGLITADSGAKIRPVNPLKKIGRASCRERV